MNALKLLLFLIWAGFALALDVLARLAGMEGLVPLLAYLGLLALTGAALVAAALVRGAVLRWSLALILAGGAMVTTGFAGATGQFLTYDAFINMLHSRGFAGEALGQFGGALARALVLSLALLFAIGLPARGRLVRSSLWAVAPLAMLALVTAVLFVRAGDGARGLPPSYPTLAYLALYAGESAMAPPAERDASVLPLESEPAGHIVLVVDESIAGHYLDINSDKGVATPLSRDWPGIEIVNYGVVPSITNCSIGTNLALRFGGTRDNYRETIAGGASIWAFAKRAGMRTVYIDAQRTGGALHNAMSDYELADIDSFVQFDAVPVIERDRLAARRIARELESSAPTLILVNKVGAHFPIHDKFPDSHMRYAPVLPRGGFTDIVDTGDRDGFDGSRASWRLYRNSYRNAVGWSVGSFFETLFEEADLASTVLVYTADHGQDLHGDGRTGLVTHCRSEPVSAEGAVPLVAITGERRMDADFVASGNGSHYRIVPTMLRLMGYERQAITRLYGPDLFDPAPEPDTFNARFNARLGHDPIWYSIAADALVNPVEADRAPE